nr:glycine zipper 2TM domain-containing protein [Ruegeria sp. SCSIO 43209]
MLGGTALGGVVGNRFGGGTGKTLATAAGAGVGMYAGQSACN